MIQDVEFHSPLEKIIGWLSFQYDDSIKVITGQVDHSIKKRKYTVSIFLTSQYKIEKAACECPNGQHRCRHMAALETFNAIQEWRCQSSGKFVWTAVNILSIDREGARCSWVGYTWLFKQDPGPIAYRSQIVEIIVNVESVSKLKNYLNRNNKDVCGEIKIVRWANRNNCKVKDRIGRYDRLAHGSQEQIDCQ